VLRIMHRAVSKPDLGELGMTAFAREHFEQAIRQPYGAVVVCGPTGSGKTTTLYTALHLLNDPGHVIMTIEDPVEDQIRGINHIEISPKRGLLRARAADDPALRSRRLARRRDPRRGDGADRDAGRHDRPPRPHHRPRAQRGERDRALEGHGRRARPARECRQLHRRPAPPPTRSWRRSACWNRRVRSTSTVRRLRTLRRYRLPRPSRPLRGAAGDRRDPEPRRRLDRRDLRGRRARRDDDASRRRAPLCLEGVSSLEEIRRVTGDRG